MVLKLTIIDDPRFVAIDELDFLKADCNTLITEMYAICTPDQNGDYPAAFRMVATPFLYAVWERCFSTSFGIMAKFIRETHQYPAIMSANQAALWLQKEPFLQSFIDRIRQRPPESEKEIARRTLNQGAYKTLVSFMTSMVTWYSERNHSGTDDGELVMTFSNINAAVLDLNAEAIGLSEIQEFKDFRKKVGRLDDLVGRRNDIAHGTLARPPGSREFTELGELVKNILINEYCEVVQTWIAYSK